MAEKLALHGGAPVRKEKFPDRVRFGAEELAQLKEALDQQTLFYMYGKKVKEYCAKFAEMYGVPYCSATSSGTASIHAALGAVGVTEGDEVILTPITDMGSLIGILYQNAIPIFADLDPHTYNIDIASLESKITEKTKAILAIHLAGNPADMDPIMAVAKKHGVAVVEDCAQSFECFYKGRLAGTIGDLGCFSTNDHKHISTGDGGMVLSHDEAMYRKVFMFSDKNYDRFGLGGAVRTISCVAPNYRMTELQAAVGIAQLDRLREICRKRTENCERLTRGISGLPGITPPKVLEGCRSSYWFYMMRIDEAAAGVSRKEFCQAVVAEGVQLGAGYIPEPVYMYPLFQNLSAYVGTHAPFDSKYYGKPVSYPKGLCPVSEAILDTAMLLRVTEAYSEQDVDDVIAAIRKVSAHYAGA